MVTILQIVDYDPLWPELFLQEKARVLPVLGPSVKNLVHMGSTSVPGLPAKPKIDMCAVCTTDFPSEEENQRMVDLGYTLSENSEALGHSAYNLDRALPAYTLHWFREDHVGLKQVLWFRDQLLKDPELCMEYATIKRDAAKNHPDNRWAYTRHKDPFIQRVMSSFPDGGSRRT